VEGEIHRGRFLISDLPTTKFDAERWRSVARPSMEKVRNLLLEKYEFLTVERLASRSRRRIEQSPNALYYSHAKPSLPVQYCTFFHRSEIKNRKIETIVTSDLSIRENCRGYRAQEKPAPLAGEKASAPNWGPRQQLTLAGAIRLASLRLK
jgi:hypothetical protein